MGELEERIARNNLIFREANEQIRSKAVAYGAPLERTPFLCECAQPGCVTIVRLTAEEYTEVRDNPHHYFTAAGHENAEEPVGQVVSRRDSYVVVEKERSER